MKQLCDYECGKESVVQFKNGKNCCSLNVNTCEGKRKKNREAARKNEKIETDNLCHYGCGQKAKYKLKNGKLHCSESHNACPSKVKTTKGGNKKNGQKIESENLCDYGCGQKAQYKFQNLKLCCSELFFKCENVKKQKGPPGSTNTKRRKRAKNKNPSPFKGKTYEEIYGKEEGDARRKKASDIRKGRKNYYSEETKKRMSASSTRQMFQRYASGWEGKAGRCKKIDYESQIAGKIKVDGTWELATAKYLDSIHVTWQRNKNRFKYFNEIQNREATYCPDFYVQEWNTYIEVKGYTTELDLCKWKQFQEKLEIWNEKKLKELKII